MTRLRSCNLPDFRHRRDALIDVREPARIDVHVERARAFIGTPSGREARRLVGDEAWSSPRATVHDRRESTSNPSAPCVNTSGMPPTGVVMAGNPRPWLRAAPSAHLRHSDGSTNTSLSASSRSRSCASIHDSTRTRSPSGAASLRTPSTSPSPASTRRARARNAVGQRCECIHEVIASPCVSRGARGAGTAPACVRRGRATRAGTRTGFGSTTTCDGDTSHSSHVEIAPLRRERDQHVGVLQRAAHDAAQRRRQTAMELVEAPRRARAGPAAAAHAPPCPRGSACAACCRATRSGCARWPDRCRSSARRSALHRAREHRRRS